MTVDEAKEWAHRTAALFTAVAGTYRTEELHLLFCFLKERAAKTTDADVADDLELLAVVLNSVAKEYTV